MHKTLSGSIRLSQVRSDASIVRLTLLFFCYLILLSHFSTTVHPRCMASLIANRHAHRCSPLLSGFLAFRAASCGCFSQLVWVSELCSAPPMVVCTGGSRAPLDAPRLSSVVVSCACGAPAPATTISAHLVALPLLSSSSPR
jgi:hypothetical protein